MGTQLLPMPACEVLDHLIQPLAWKGILGADVQCTWKEADGWDEDWEDWGEDAEEESRETTPDTDQEGEATSEAHRWLQECLVSVSPAADLIAVARKDKLVLLSPKYNADSRNEEVMSQYHTVWSGSVVHNSEEQVTAVMCLPLASQKRSTQGGPDWTCVLLGFSSGFLRFYTETGTLLLSQKLHNEPVQKLKCNTYTPKRYLGIAEQHEELVILYKRVLVTIDGFSLYQALKACRNQVARATASGETSLQPPPLAYKKWAPQDMESGSSQPILSEVAFAVASKLKSAIMSAARFGLPDQRRAGLCVSLSPNNTYAATTDSFGRVILIDVAQGVAARMWKGYRDAQVGWVEVREEEGPHSASRQSRSAQFLVIYAARRGILEIWLAGNGPRVAAFNVSKHCQLVSISHGILGLNNVTCKGVRIKAFQVALIEPNESLNAQVRDLLLNIRIPSIAQQGVDKVLNTSYLDPDFMEGIVKACTKRLKVAGEDEGNIERRLFLQYCHLQETLIHTYREIRHLKSSKAAPTTDTQSLADLLGLQESEAEHLSSLVDRYLGVAGAGRSGAHVHFQDDMVTSAATFLACFTCTPHTTDTGSAGAISLSKDLPDEKKLELAPVNVDLDADVMASSSDQESSWWHGLREMCSHSSLCLSSYLGSMVSKAVAMEMLGLAPKTENRDQDLAAKDPDADTISMCETPSPVVEKSPSPTEEMAESTPVDIEAWNLLCKQLEDLTDIDCFLKLSSSEHMQVVNQSEELKVNVAAMLDGGKGCISEIVARHIARVGYLPQDLYKPLQEEQAGQAGDKTYSASEQAVLDAMDSLRRRFPHSLENDTLFSNCCWEYAVLWNKLPEVGKVPKDRLCRKEIGISEVRLGLFVGGVVDFLSIVMDANCETNEVPVFNLEQIWAQKGTNYGLLTVFHQLATLMQAVITFNMKPVKVLSLFDSKWFGRLIENGDTFLVVDVGRHSLSQDLHNHPLLPNTNIDSSITVQRKQFMTRVITQAVIKMRESCPLTFSAMESGSPPNTTTSKLRLSEAGRWPEVIMTLADQFGQDVDYFKRHYVCELYSAGFDRLADEVLVTVNEREPLGTQLLTIAGQRVAYKLSVMDAQMVVDLMSNVNPALSTWLKSMNWALLLQAEVDNADIASLVRHSVSLLPEGHQQYELAAALDTLTYRL
ncbi:RBGPR-like protein [Mya arenaria]|uniref:RBGPR-like protein n=1 Tax=Mya arenaria TaxID=6604 RepID=A0ABY7FBM8_MYAAR|nr:RBGPR-like protein [Mya arenaria]